MGTEELRQLILLTPIFLLSISFHEFAHAWTAFRLGDKTPLYDGRLTLNFMAHLSLWGTLMFLIARIGWAKPVRVTMRNLQNPKRDMLLISAAGPLANFSLAAVFAIVYKIVMPYLVPGTVGGLFREMIAAGVWLNVLLGLFNLIPIPPLDGANILGPLLPRSARLRLQSMEPWGFLLIFFLFVYAGLNRYLLTVVWTVSRWLL